MFLGNWKNSFSSMTEKGRSSLCENLNSALLFKGQNNIDNYIFNNFPDIPDDDFTDLLFFNENTRKDHNCKVNLNTDLCIDSDHIQATTLSCEFENSVVHLAKNSNFNFFFLFSEKTGTHGQPPMLLAFLVPYLEIYILPNLKEEHFYTYIASKRQTKSKYQ